MMRALTVREPWATAIVWGTKRLDNHSWKPALGYIGETVAIHVGKNITQDEWGAVESVIKKVGNRSCSIDIVGRDGSRITTFAGLLRDRMLDESERGCVIGVVTLVDVIAGNTEAIRLGQEEWFKGPFAHVLADVRRVSPPVPAKGKLRYWTLPVPVEALVRDRIKENLPCSP